VDSVKLNLPVARSTGGSCGRSVTLLLANSYSPATFVAARLVIGSSSFRRSLPLPSAHRLGETAGPALDRRRVDEFKKVARSPVGLAADDDERRARDQARNTDAHVRELRTEQRAAAADDFHPVALEQQLGVDVVDERPGARVVQHALFDAR